MAELLTYPVSGAPVESASAVAAPASWKWRDFESEWVPAATGAKPWEELAPAWRACHRRYTPDDLGGELEWCRALAASRPGTMQALVIRRRGEIVGVVPMMLRAAELDCQLGEWKYLRLRPRLLEPVGEAPALPPDRRAYNSWLGALARQRRSYDAISLTLAADTPLAAAVDDPGFHRWGWRSYQPQAAAAHHRIRMPGSFDAYMAKFTSKTRKNRLRELRHLEQKGRLELVRFAHGADIEPFLAEAGAISSRSYQQKLMGAGLSEPEHLRARMHLAAERGWLRSYVLRCGGIACSYMLGYQYEDRFHYTKVGYDPAWADLSVGSALQLLVLQDLFAERTPALFDFGSHGPQKQYFGNESFLEQQLYLFNRRPYPVLAMALHAGARGSNAVGSRWLTRMGVKPRVNRWLRHAAGC